MPTVSHRGPLSAEAQALAADPRHVAFARKLARARAARMPWMAEEFESAAMLGLVEAARSFDPALGYRFSTHAGRRILGTILDAQRATSPAGFRRGRAEGMPRTRSIAEVGDPDTGACLADLIASDDEPVGWEIEAQDAVEGMLEGLPTVVRRAMLPVYIDCRSGGLKQGAGRLLGLSPSRISQHHERGLAILRSGPSTTNRGEIEMALSGSNCAHPVPVDGRPMDLDELARIRAAKVPPGADAAKAAYPAVPTGPEPDPRIAELVRRREASKPATAAEPARADVAPARRKSKYRGVCWRPKESRWRATVCLPGSVVKYAGASPDEVEAARLYDHKAREILGDRAKLNFPDEIPNDPPPTVVRPKPDHPRPLPEPPAPIMPTVMPVAIQAHAALVAGPAAPAPADDPEIAAIVALAALDAAARRRVMDWTNARFGH